jgi:autotransporter-associated beta strand protein
MGGANTGDTVSSSSVVDTASGGSLNLLGNVTFNSNGNPLGSTISAALNLGSATRSFTIADSTTAPIDLIVSGIISADPGVGLTKAGAGTLMISGPNTYTGPTNINLGTLRLGSAAALPAASTLNVYANSAGAVALLDINGRNATAAALNLGANSGGANSASIANVIDSAGGGLLTVNGGVNYSATNNPQGSTIFAALDLGSASRTFTIANSTAAANDLTVAGIISAAPGVGLSKAGAGTLMLTGANTYTGTTTISAGTLSLAGSGALAGDIVVASGATFDTSSPAGFTIVSGRTLTANGTFTAGSGGTLTVSGTLKGSGTVAAAGIVSVNSGGLLSPGNSLGTLATGDETWNSGGGYVWELNNASDASGAKGVTYDWMNISGTLTLNSTSDGKFTIYLTSLNAGNTPGSVPNFVEGTSYSYVIATATSGITGFNASKFNVDTTGFSNPIADASIFRVGNDLVLQFTAIPEPSTYAIGIPGLLGAAILLRRRRFFSEGKAE